MSVEKVNKYKAERAVRNENLKKEKLEKLIAKLVIIVVAIAAIVWIGFSVYQKLGINSSESDATTVNVNALDNYLNTFEVIEANPGE